MSRKRAPLPTLGPLFDSPRLLPREVAGDPMGAPIAGARAAGVARMVTVAIDLPTAREAQALAAAHEDIFATVGLHPTDVPGGAARDEALDGLRAMAEEEGWVAIGETGLDLFHRRNELADQLVSLEAHLELGAAHGLPVILHCRDAIDELMPVLRAAGKVEGVMHCFSEPTAPLDELLEIGLHFSFAGNLGYPKSEDLREVARRVPPERLLVETDAPFLAPQPRRGKRNEPAFVAFTAELLGELHGMDGEAMAALTYANGCRLFGLQS